MLNNPREPDIPPRQTHTAVTQSHPTITFEWRTSLRRRAFRWTIYGLAATVQLHIVASFVLPPLDPDAVTVDSWVIAVLATSLAAAITGRVLLGLGLADLAQSKGHTRLYGFAILLTICVQASIGMQQTAAAQRAPQPARSPTEQFAWGLFTFVVGYGVACGVVARLRDRLSDLAPEAHTTPSDALLAKEAADPPRASPAPHLKDTPELQTEAPPPAAAGLHPALPDSPTQPHPPPSLDIDERLAKLSQLRDKGRLSDEEFAKAKALLLGLDGNPPAS